VIDPRPLPSLRAQIPFERTFTPTEFSILKRGFVAESMEDRWNILFHDPWLSFFRSWTGFCIYKVRFKESAGQFKIADVWVNCDCRQYGGDNVQEEVKMLSFLIQQLISGREPCAPHEILAL
jgi:hypothetical protein